MKRRKFRRIRRVEPQWQRELQGWTEDVLWIVLGRCVDDFHTRENVHEFLYLAALSNTEFEQYFRRTRCPRDPEVLEEMIEAWRLARAAWQLIRSIGMTNPKTRHVFERLVESAARQPPPVRPSWQEERRTLQKLTVVDFTHADSNREGR